MERAVPRPENTLLFDVDAITDGIFTVNEQLQVASWNGAAQGLLGYSSAEVIGHRCPVLIAQCPGLRAARSTPQSHHVTQHDAASALGGETPVTTRDGATKWLSVSTFLAQTHTGEPRIVHFLRDASEHHSMHVTNEHRVRHFDGRSDMHHGTSRSSHTPSPPPPHLTRREIEVLGLLALGHSTAEIAQGLSISRVTARNHVTNIIAKLEVKTRLQAVIVAARVGII
jgi:PAS domain S-box-containing protein